MATFGTQVLTDEILADLQPSLTSTTIVAFRPKDLRRSGTVPRDASLSSGRDESLDVDVRTDEELFDSSVLAASSDIATERISKKKSAEPAFSPFGEPTPVDGLPVIPRKKPTDSFTLNPEFAKRVFESQSIEVVHPVSGEHLALVRGIVYRDDQDRVAKIQCFLKKGEYLSADGGKVEFVVEGKRYRVKDGFYVTPRGAGKGEWCYLGYVS